MPSFNMLHLDYPREIVEVIEPHVNCDAPDDIIKVEEIDGMVGWSSVCGPGINIDSLTRDPKELSMDTHTFANKKPTLSMRTYVPTSPVVITESHRYISNVRILYTSSLHLIASLLELRRCKVGTKTSYQMADYIDNLKPVRKVILVDGTHYKIKLYKVAADVFELNDLL